jgi:ferredoxin-like protein FixX
MIPERRVVGRCPCGCYDFLGFKTMMFEDTVTAQCAKCGVLVILPDNATINIVDKRRIQIEE